MALLKANTGIGITNPSEALHVIGNGLFVGVVSATSFTGNLTGTATSAINLVGGEQGSVPYQSSNNSTTFLSPGTPGQVLITAGNGQNPYWAPVNSASGSFGGITVQDEGNVVGSASSISSLNFVGSNITATASGVAATITISNNLVGTALSISGISTFTNGPVLVGSGTSTGTTAQRLQVTGGAYVSDNLGIGTTNPTSKLQVVGDGLFTGVVTATTFDGSFTGSITGNATSADKLFTPRTISLTGDIEGSVSFDGSTDVSIASTIQPNSVGLGTDTFGDYVKDITGTSNQITVTSGTGEGSTPTLSIPNQFTVPQDLTVIRDVQINRNLNVNGNITIGGTSATIFSQSLNVFDPDIVLGYRTDANGNDVSNDNTANHGGIAIASTEGNPLVELFIAGIETNPATYKKIMWFKEGTFAGLGTDAWLSNYAIGIGSTQFPTGTRLAAGSVQFTENDLAVVRNINASGIISATTFAGSFQGTSSYAEIAGIATNVIGGIGSITQLQVTGISTFTNGPVLIGSGTSTGTTAQRLQVTGGTYVSGNLGIGTTNPTSKLHVIGNGLFTGVVTSEQLGVTGVSTFTNGPVLIGSATSTGTVDQKLQVTGGAYVSGNLGFGITNPGAKLQVTPTSTGIAGLFSGTTSSDMVRITQTGTGNAIVVEDSTNPDSSPFVVTGAGSVGIGVTNPGYELQVNGNISLTASNQYFYTNKITKLDQFFELETYVAYNSVNPTITWYGGIGSKLVYNTSLLSLYPSISGGLDFGTSSNLWRYGYYSGTLFVGSATSTGTASQRLQVTGGAYVSGNLGVGTTNPSQSLHVQGNLRLTGALYDGNNNQGSSGQILSSTGSAISWINPNTTNVGSANSIAITLDSTNASRYLTFVSTTSGNNVVYVDSDLLYNPSTNSLGINTTSFTGTTAQRLQVTGGAYVSDNLGIGTTNPTSKLHVIGNGLFTGVVTATTFIGNLSGYASTSGIATYATNSGIATYASNAGIATSVIGGIGSITQLQVTGISTFTNGPVLVGSGTSTGTTAQRLQVTGGTYVSGNLGIGTTNPTSKLQVQGDVSIASTVGIGTVIDIIPYDTLNSGTLSFEGSAGQLFSITNNLTSGSIFSVNDVSGIPSIDVDANGTIQLAPYGGNIGIGTTNPLVKLQVGGTIGFNDSNIKIGDNTTGCSITSGVDNFFAGVGAGRCNTTGSNNNFFGRYAGFANTTGSDNNFFGRFAGQLSSTGCNNNILGNCAGRSNIGSNNNFLGFQAGYYNTTGNYNNFFGIRAGFANTTGGNNNFFGCSAGRCNTIGSNNFFVGDSAGRSNTSGSFNNFLGFNAGFSNISGVHNNFLGCQAGYYNTTGNYNNFFGMRAGFANTTGSGNNYIGSQAGRCNTTGFSNNFLGLSAGYTNSTGSNNNFLGRCAGFANTSGSNNFFGGYFAGLSNTTGGSNNFLGNQAGRFNTTGSNNNFFGVSAGRYNTTGSNNFFGGYFAGFGNTTGNNNIFIGFRAGQQNTTGNGNNFLGSGAGQHNTTGFGNNFLGSGAGQFSTIGTYNNFFGVNAGFANTSGSGNNFFGQGAGRFNTIGCHNNFSGYYSGRLNTIGCYNNFFGLQTGCGNTTGSHNNFLGRFAGCNNTSGSYNNFFGNAVGGANTSGSNNNFFGNQAGRFNTTGCYNNFFGCQAGYCNTTGFENNFFGVRAGYFNTIGCRNNFLGGQAGRSNTTGSHNNFFGFYGGFANTTGGNNNFFGCSAGRCNTSGNNNNFFGCQAGYCNTTGGNNNFFGCSAGRCNTSGNNNNFFGCQAGYCNTTGNDNIFIGNQAGRFNTTGSNNNFFGASAGRYNTTGNYNSFFGFNSGYNNTTGSYNVAIGNNAQLPLATGSCQLTIASGNTAWIYGDISGNIGFGTTSPSAKLQVVPTSTGIAGLFSGTTSSDMVRITQTGTGNALVVEDEANPDTSPFVITGIGSVGIGTASPQYKLHVVGDFGATTKSFVIPHPTRPGMTLRHGSLEGNELAVYVRGKTTESIIPLPDYWTGLVNEESITVNLTPKNGKLHSVVGVSSNIVEIECIGGEIECYFMILGERKDVAKLVVEY